MKVLRAIFPVFVMLFLLPLQTGAEGLGNARLSLIDGDVQIKPDDSSEWLPASINMPLREGDRIWVPDNGKAEVQTTGGSQVRLDQNTSLEILNLENDSSQFYLSAGSAYVNFRSGRSRLVQFDTPVASIRAYERATFAVDVSNGDTDLSVYRGSVNAESRSGRTTVNSGRMLSIGDDYADLAPLGRSDEWERWNMDRDRRYEDRSYTSSRYLPQELDTYSSDFDDNGRWVTVRDYGYVWTPTVSASVGWTPYRNGRWCWIGGDYVWVGYEPWGWAPYHYGRWSFAASIGWFWVPPARGAVYWGPGFVGWVSTPTYVAWVPLAPGETYYGHGHYGPHSVNIVNVNVNKVVINKVYKNVHVHNGVNVVHRDTFVRGRHVDFKPDRNPFLKEKAHIGRPNIRPERETRMAVIRDIPREKEPPQKIRELKVKEIREQRRLMKEKDKSVFVTDRPQRELRVISSEAPKERKKGRAFERRREQEQGGKPAERRQPEEREMRSVAPEKQKAGGPGTRGRDRKDMKQNEDARGASPAVRPLEERKQRRIERVDQQPETPRRGGDGAGPQSSDTSPQKRKDRIQQQEGQPAERFRREGAGQDAPGRDRPSQRQIEKKQQQEERRLKQPDRTFKPSEEGDADRKRMRPADQPPVQDRQIRREEGRRREAAEEAAQQQRRQEKRKKIREQQTEAPAEEAPQGRMEREGRGGR